MKNRSSKTILVFFALGLISCAFCVQQAQAVPINAVLSLSQGAHSWTPIMSIRNKGHGLVGRDGDMPTVQSVSGGFAAFVNVGRLGNVYSYVVF